LAGPNGASVVGGAATVQGQGTSNVTINQTSQSAIINWNTFNIGAGETTRINMPSASSVELDRVTGGLGPSQILGSLYSNGRVFLVNPDGILFGAGSRINVGGLLATTNDISNADFMAGRYRFTIPGYPAASIVNQGSITAQSGGFAALVAPGVRNTGTITANLGTVALASGNAFTLDFYGDNLIKLGLNDSIASQVIDVSTGKPLSSLVSNAGTLKANGGKVELTAVAARKVVDSVINNTGNIEANTIGTHNGMIVLGAATAANKPPGAPTQTVKVAGTLSAAGKQKGTTGGTIVVTGENVQLSGANINASGQAGGGTVLIGGDWGGGHPNTGLVSNPNAYLQPYAVPTASTVSIDAATTINGSATNAGNGGKVIVWSNEATTFYGTILAQGGSQSGQGGFVETSGHQLSFNGAVNTGAPHGANGTLLLDPLNATIATNSGSEVITVSSIESALANGDVVVTTVGTTGSEAGDIIVASSLSWTNANTLALNAYRNIDINSGVTISNTGAGSLVLRADATGTGNGTVNFAGTGSVNFSGSTGTVSIFYNPSDNPAGSLVNATSYTTPFDYSPYITTNSAVPNQLMAYMLVNTVYDLQNIQNNLSGNYALGTSFDATVTATWNGGTGFAPIGSDSNRFTGTLNGLGETISNLTINSTSGLFEVGIFGSTAGVVENLNITNATVFGSGLGTGILAGSNDGVISNVNASGSVSTSANLSSLAGGLVGTNGGEIIGSSAAVNVFAGRANDFLYGTDAGGLVGYNVSVGTIIQSFATGTVSAGSGVAQFAGGGLVGGNLGTISLSYATGPVSATLGNIICCNSGVGGLVGVNGNVVGAIEQSYATGSVTTDVGIAGALVGITINESTIQQSYATGLVTSGYVSGGGSSATFRFAALLAVGHSSTIIGIFRPQAGAPTGF
jgi:filamentous hemagglutinin family protein